MSLKITAALILALVAHSSAFAVKSRRNEGATIPGFTWTSEKTAEHDKLKLTAPDGKVRFSLSLLNTTAYKYSSENGVKKIGQQTLLPGLRAIFEDVDVQNGGVTTKSELIVSADNSTFDFALFTKDGGLGAEFKTLEALPHYYASFGENSAAFEQPAVEKDLNSFLAKVLAPVDKVVEEKLFIKALKERLTQEEFDKLVKDLEASDAKSFPEPEFY